MVQLGKADVRCLLDTGAQVSTITETYFNEYFADEERLVDVAPYIRITAANGLGIPYRGYFEADVTMFGQTFQNMGFLVEEDPTSTTSMSGVSQVCKSNSLICSWVVVMLGTLFVMTVQICMNRFDRWSYEL